MDQTFSSQLPGKVLAGKFRIERVLGTGGMGVVVAAEHLQLRQRVAIKLLLPELLQRADIVGRFEREARATARLKNDHVARILDVGVLPTGAPYIVMEHLDGCDLSALLAHEGVQRPDDAVLYVLQACEALAEAHAAGIVHRDLKPQNLFLTRTMDNRPLIKVLDFGVSRFADAGDDVHLTRTSAVVGSPAYMAPEQMRSARNADERSDIWSLGVVLYELVTGKLPFLGETVTDLYAKVVSGPPPAPDVSPELSAIIMQCLSVDPAERPPSVAELSRALAPMAASAGSVIAARIHAVTSARGPIVLASSPKIEVDLGIAHTVATDSSPPPRRRALAIVLGGLVVAAGLVVAVTIERRSELARPKPEPPPPLAIASAPPIASPPPSPTALDPPADAAAATVAVARPPTRPRPTPSARPAASAPPPAAAVPSRDDPFQNRTSF